MESPSDNPLKRFIRKIHRRSLWQVLGIYAVASWAVLQVVDTLGGALNLPDGFDSVALALLILGLPIVLATAFVAGGAARETRHIADLPTPPAAPGPLEDAAVVAADAPTRMWRQLAVIFAVLFILAAGVAGWSQLRPDPPQPVTRIVLTPASGVDIGGGTRGLSGLTRRVDGGFRRRSDGTALPA